LPLPYIDSKVTVCDDLLRLPTMFPPHTPPQVGLPKPSHTHPPLDPAYCPPPLVWICMKTLLART